MSGKVMKIFCLLAVGFILFHFYQEDAHSYDFKKYNFIPPFIASGEAPSVLFLCDTSGSMDHFAYAKTVNSYEINNDVYDQNEVYYGYFDPYAYYRYVKCEDNDDSYARSGFFEENDGAEGTDFWQDSLGEKHGCYAGNEDGVDNVDPDGDGLGVGNYEWSGNFLNYISMRRTDILKRVLMGGRRAPDNFGNIFDSAPAGYDTGGSVNRLDYLVVGDHLYYGDRSGSEFEDESVPLPPGPTGTEPNRPAGSHYLTPHGNGAASVTVEYEVYQNSSCGSSHLYPIYIKFHDSADVTFPDFPTEAKGERRKLLALKLPAGEQPQGIVQRTGAQVRFGAMRFNSDNQGGEILVPVGDTDHLCAPISGSCPSACTAYGVGSDSLGDGFRMDGVIEAINDLDADGNTPLGESLATAVLYYQQNGPYYHAGDFTQSKAWDPYFFNKDMNTDCSVAGDEGEYVICSKGYVIILTDGEPTSDTDFPGWVTNYSDGGNDGSTQIDDVARYAHINDLRPSDLTHDGNDYEFSTVDNALNIYPVFTFGAGGGLLESTARNGGFVDKNGDSRPNTVAEESSSSVANKEWDFDGDNLPDNYFEANSGEEIESSLIIALSDILNRAASGSAASIIAGSRSGAGSIFQAIFYPEMQEHSGTRTVAWTGYLHALFMDDYGNMWEDFDGDNQLDVPGDRIVQLYWNSTDNATKVRYYTNSLPNGEPDPATQHADSFDPARNNITNIKPIWEAGQMLTEWSDAELQTQRAYSAATGGRYIFTWVDSNNNGIVTPSEVIAFDESHRLSFETYFNLPIPADPDYIPGSDLVEWIRGIDVSGLRSRQIDCDADVAVETWRLGDIVYSTPTVVGRPAEALDLIYRDDSYRAFYSDNRNRRQVIYVGANDGMLHAFNAGFYDEEHKQYLTDYPDVIGETQYELGQELWAFIPFDLLPHLQALPQIDYDSVHGNHVCFVDLKPRIMDVKFSDNQWHTVLVCGMRLGGGEVTVNGDTLKSAYFALDITDPEIPPQLLWSFNDTHGAIPVGSNNLGFTTSYPAVVNTYDGSGNIKNYMVFGSGLTTLNPSYPDAATSPYPLKSDHVASLYAVNIETGAAKVIAPSALNPFTDINSYFGDPVAINLNYYTETRGNNLCYASHLLYVGVGYDPDAVFSTPSQGKIYRLMTMNSSGTPETDPAQWRLSTLCDVGKPVSSAPNVTVAGIRDRSRKKDYKTFINQLDVTTESHVPLVCFGTGEYWFGKDKEDRSRQGFFGIKEPVSIVNNGTKNVYKFSWATLTTADMMDVSDAEVYGNKWVDINGDGTMEWTDFNLWVDDFMKVDMTTPASDHFSNYNGWLTELEEDAERVIGQPAILGGVVIFTSYLPSNEVCVTEGQSYLYALHYLTGTAYYDPILGENTGKKVTDVDGDHYLSLKSCGLGEGLGITATLHSGGEDGEARAYVQTSTGAIVEVKTDTVYDVLGPGIHMKSWLNID